MKTLLAQKEQIGYKKSVGLDRKPHRSFLDIYISLRDFKRIEGKLLKYR